MFTFKQFTIDDSACAMKVGTDGVLLGTWVPVSNARTILDIGTGSGLIALIMAQRNAEAIIDAIDIDDEAVSQARKNISESPFAGRVHAFEADFLLMDTDKKYDLIVSNPPFYIENTSCPDGKRDMARHASSLPFDSLICRSRDMLIDGGMFCVIIPTTSVIDFIGTAAQHRMYLCRRTDIHTTPRKQAKRTMLVFTHLSNTESITDKLFMRDESNAYTREYRELTHDFYLDMN